MDKIAAARKNMAARVTRRKLKGRGPGGRRWPFVRQSYNPASTAYLQTLRDFVQLEKQIMLETREQLGRTVDHGQDRSRGGGFGVARHHLRGVLPDPQHRAAAANQHLAGRIAEGDLSQRETITRGDEFGELLRSLYAMSDSLGRMVHQVRQSTDSIATASAEIAAGNHDLSARTEQTSSNLQETAAAMECSPAPSSKAPQTAQQASSLAAGASGWRGVAARWWRRSSRPWTPSSTAARRSPTSLA